MSTAGGGNAGGAPGATTSHGYMLDFNLVFVSDDTASYGRSLHESTLVNIRNHYEVVTIDELIACWQESAHKAPAAAPVGSAR